MSMKPDNRLEGLTIIYDRYNGDEVGKVDGKAGDFFWGTQGIRGRFMIQDANNRTLFEYDADKNMLVLRNRQGQVTFCVDGESGEISRGSILLDEAEKPQSTA